MAVDDPIASEPMRGRSTGRRAGNTVGGRPRNIGVPGTWSAILGRAELAGLGILAAGVVA